MSQLDGSNGRPLERADFAASRVRGSRRPPILVLGWVVVLGGVMALGLSARSGGSGSEAVVANAASPAASTFDFQPNPSFFRIIDKTIPPRFEPDFPSFPTNIVATSEPGPINLQASRHPSTIFVHGDVFAQQVTWVFVSLQSLDGEVAGWASVSIPGAAGDSRDHRPALRFDVELAIPTGLATGVLVVQANAYNAAGGLIAATRVRLTPEM